MEAQNQAAVPIVQRPGKEHQAPVVSNYEVLPNANDQFLMFGSVDMGNTSQPIHGVNEIPGSGGDDSDIQGNAEGVPPPSGNE